MIIRPPIEHCFFNVSLLNNGLTWQMIHSGINYTYKTLDKIETTLIQEGSPRLSKLVELANLSSMIGNLLANGIVKNSKKSFEKAAPNKYQDLRSTKNTSKNIEIKMSLEKNSPKGHLPKEGQYLTCRYVLGNQDGTYTLGKRGDFIWIWEIRFGYLKKHHFNVSNTANDSGKTAIVNSKGMKRLKPIFFNENHCPYGLKSKIRKELKTQFER